MIFENRNFCLIISCLFIGPLKLYNWRWNQKRKEHFWSEDCRRKEKLSDSPVSVILLCKNWLSPLIWLQLELVVGCEIVGSSRAALLGSINSPPPPALTRNNHHRTEKLIKHIATTTALLQLELSTKLRQFSQYSVNTRPLRGMLHSVLIDS